MVSVTAELRRLRLAAKPPLSLRAMASLLEVPTTSYSRYESEKYFKRPYLPMEFVRRIAPILMDRGVDPSEIMGLAGLSRDEAEPEVRSLQKQERPVQQVLMPVTLPSEGALAEMFLVLLQSMDDDLPKAERARLLARRLPIGLRQLQGLLLELDIPSPLDAPEAYLPPPHREARQPSRR